MQAHELAKHAEMFARYLAAKTNTAVTCTHVAAVDDFINIYHNALPSGSGVYWFYIPDREVFYIGKANDFTRIWDHTFAADDIEEGVRGFPKCIFASNDWLSAENQADVLKGRFRIDFMSVSPGDLALSFEVYLQTVFLLMNKSLPACNSQIGGTW